MRADRKHRREAGVGKSRLFYEFFAEQRWQVLRSGALSYEKTTSWAPVIDLLRSLSSWRSWSGARNSPRVSARMSELDRQLEDDIAPILSLLDALPENDNFRLLDARERRQRIPDGPDAVVPGSKRARAAVAAPGEPAVDRRGKPRLPRCAHHPAAAAACCWR